MKAKWWAAAVAAVAVVAAVVLVLLPGGAASVLRALGFPAPGVASVLNPAQDVVLPGTDATALSLQLTADRFASAGTVVVATASEAAAASEQATTRTLPLVVVPEDPAAVWDQIRGEVERLGATGVAAYGVTVPEDLTEVDLDGVKALPTDPQPYLAMAPPELDLELAAALVAPSGGQAFSAPADPRASAATIEALAAAPETAVVALGESFGSSADLAWKAATARTGVQLPGGGQLAAPGKLYVALYGHPTTASLGMLGEQGVEATIARAKEHAAPYQDLVDVTVVPALEIIATVASAGAGDDGTYSRKSPVAELRPLVDAAAENGLYVVLDLQPGRTDFLTQAKLYEELLALPHVGLALDPEWRLKPDQVHLRQIGQVDTAEVNQVVTWLADFTRERHLPQKVLILHSFQNRMVTNIDQLDTSRAELAIVMHVDGQGGQGAKQGTWNTLHAYAPNIPFWGWKNFYDEDSPAMLTPAQTIADVNPTPVFVSYQ